MKDETLSCPLKDKPFGFNKSLELCILSAFCYSRENVMCWSHLCTLISFMVPKISPLFLQWNPSHRQLSYNWCFIIISERHCDVCCCV